MIQYLFKKYENFSLPPKRVLHYNPHTFGTKRNQRAFTWQKR